MTASFTANPFRTSRESVKSFVILTRSPNIRFRFNRIIRVHPCTFRKNFELFGCGCTIEVGCGRKTRDFPHRRPYIHTPIFHGRLIFYFFLYIFFFFSIITFCSLNVYSKSANTILPDVHLMVLR